MPQLPNWPQHVGIIMDGNGRWANKRGWRRFQGHIQGADRVMGIIEEAIILNIKAFSLFCFSTENWNRPSDEVNFLMDLMGKFVDRQLEKIHSLNVKIRVLGDLQNAPLNLKTQLEKSIERTKNNTGMALNFMVSYGGRLDIVTAAKKIAQSCIDKELSVEDITDEVFKNNLYTKGLPDPDLIIRTSGEFRISNFMLWQSAYAEFFVTDKLWPDFTPADLKVACDHFANRARRFGCVKEPVTSDSEPQLEIANV